MPISGDTGDGGYVVFAPTGKVVLRGRDVTDEQVQKIEHDIAADKQRRLDHDAGELLKWMRSSPYGKWMHTDEAEPIFELLSHLEKSGAVTKLQVGGRWVFECVKGSFDSNLADT